MLHPSFFLAVQQQQHHEYYQAHMQHMQQGPMAGPGAQAMKPKPAAFNGFTPTSVMKQQASKAKRLGAGSPGPTSDSPVNGPPQGYGMPPGPYEAAGYPGQYPPGMMYGQGPPPPPGMMHPNVCTFFRSTPAALYVRDLYVVYYRRRVMPAFSSHAMTKNTFLLHSSSSRCCRACLRRAKAVRMSTPIYRPRAPCQWSSWNGCSEACDVVSNPLTSIIQNPSTSIKNRSDYSVALACCSRYPRILYLAAHCWPIMFEQ